MIITHTNVKINRFPFVTLMLIVINCCVFLKTYTLEINAVQAQRDQIVSIYGSEGVNNSFVSNTSDAQQGDALEKYEQFYRDYGFSIPDLTKRKQYYALVTHIFVHGGLVHLAGNMIMLWGFGVAVEEAFGSLRFAFFYILCGFLAAFAQGFMDLSSEIPMVGASGAIAGVMGAFFILYGASAVCYWMLTLGFRVFFVPVPAPIFALIWIGSQVLYLQLETSLGESGGVAWMAHIGGVMGGILLSTMLRREVRGEIIEHNDGTLSIKEDDAKKKAKLTEQQILDQVLDLHPVRTVADSLLGEGAVVGCPKCSEPLNLDFTMADRMCKCFHCNEITYINAGVLLHGRETKQLNF